MKIYHYIIPLILLMGACSEEETFDAKKVLGISGESKALKTQALVQLNDLNVHYPMGIVKKGEMLTIGCREALYNAITVNLENKQQQSYIPRGRRAGEAVNIMNLSMNADHITALNFHKGQLIEMSSDPKTKANREPKIIQLPREKKHLVAAKAGSKIISTGIYEEGRYLLYDPETEEANYFLSYPDHVDYPRLKETTKSMLYASNVLRVRPDNEAFVCADMYSGYFDICRINGNRIERIREQHFHYPKVHISGEGKKTHVSYYRENRFGFTDIAVTNDYIFAIYSGKTIRETQQNFQYCHTLLQFNWSGELINSYKLDIPLTNISYDPEENAVFGIGHSPEATLVKLAI